MIKMKKEILKLGLIGAFALIFIGFVNYAPTIAVVHLDKTIKSDIIPLSKAAISLFPL